MVSTAALDIRSLVLEGLKGIVVDECHTFFAHAIFSVFSFW
jgi:hypothetical protein